MNTPDSSKRVRKTGKQQAILDAAISVFLEVGYESASMELVAERAATVRRTVYNHFANKEDLFHAVVQEIWRDMPVIMVNDDPLARKDPDYGLRVIANMIVDFWLPQRSVEFLRMVISESRRFPYLAASFIEVGKLPALHGLIDYIELMVAEGHMKGMDTELAARQFVGLINEPLLWYRVIDNSRGPSAKVIQNTVDAAIEMFLARHATSPDFSAQAH
ncbi:TetR/AcrR family transcriptional regulator [Paracoccus thiocyanatus]|uniref:TetR/AcrR family transcriptional regulator n=1 Tax=Paracoccus thiocyanatus TaxID=34006 RepID=UPI0015F27D64|nr:TetR/AcrR family transcriptional regulator [Paracoccus thiocyanatus]